MSIENGYKHLGPRRGSLYRQFFIKDTRIRAQSIYCWSIPPESMSPEDIAWNYDLPLEVVLECIKYCEENRELLRQESKEEEESLARNRAQDPVHYPVPPKK